MKLSEAWGYIEKERKTTSITSANVYSILTDLGVFRETPKIKFAMKSALSYGLYDLVYGSATDLDISDLKFKIANDGFSDETIMEIINSFYCSPSNSTPLVETAAEESYSEDEDSTEEIRFLGQRIERFKTTDPNFTETYLNKKLYVLPSPLLNTINIHNLDFSFKAGKEHIEVFKKYHPSSLGPSGDKDALCLEYDITSYNVSNRTGFNLCAILVDNKDHIRCKANITNISPSEKYMIRKDVAEFFFYRFDKSLNPNNIKYLILYAEVGKINEFSESPSYKTKIDLFKRYNGTFNVDINEISDYNIDLSGIDIWGNQNACYIAFKLESTLSRIRINFIFFDKNNKIIDVYGGYNASRTFSLESSINGIFLKYIDLKCDFNDVSKVIIDCQ